MVLGMVTSPFVAWGGRAMVLAHETPGPTYGSTCPHLPGCARPPRPAWLPRPLRDMAASRARMAFGVLARSGVTLQQKRAKPVIVLHRSCCGTLPGLHEPGMKTRSAFRHHRACSLRSPALDGIHGSKRPSVAERYKGEWAHRESCRARHEYGCARDPDPPTDCQGHAQQGLMTHHHPGVPSRTSAK